MSYAVPSLQPIRDEIDREVVINAGWVNVADQRGVKTEYENTTGRTYEIMMRVDGSGGAGASVRLRNPDGAIIDVPLFDLTILSFQLKPGESVEVINYVSATADIKFWFERQL